MAVLSEVGWVFLRLWAPRRPGPRPRKPGKIYFQIRGLRDPGKFGQAAASAPADCAQLTSVEAMRDRVNAELGAPDIVVAFAGGGTGWPMPLEQITEEDWRSSIDNNLTSAFFTLWHPGQLCFAIIRSDGANSAGNIGRTRATDAPPSHWVGSVIRGMSPPRPSFYCPQLLLGSLA